MSHINTTLCVCGMFVINHCGALSQQECSFKCCLNYGGFVVCVCECVCVGEKPVCISMIPKAYGLMSQVQSGYQGFKGQADLLEEKQQIRETGAVYLKTFFSTVS